jgi:hypothetical protein
MPDDSAAAYMQSKMSEAGSTGAAVPPMAGSGWGEAPALQSPPTDWVTPLLALIITVGFFGLLTMLCCRPVPKANADMINIVLGSLGTAWVGAMAHFFGSSRSGQRKDWMLFQSTPNGPTADTPKAGR